MLELKSCELEILKIETRLTDLKKEYWNITKL